MTASLTLSAFGQMVASTGGSTSAYQFGATSGYRTEGDAGLTLVGCRFYDAQVGRFITRDTYLDQAPYTYCDGDPVNCTDPSGHQPRVGPAKEASHEEMEKIGHLGNIIMIVGTGVAIFCPPAGVVIIVLGIPCALMGEIDGLTKPGKKE